MSDRQIVTTDEELEALPTGTIIRDAWGEPLTKDHDDPIYYQWTYGEVPVADVKLPAIVLWLPEGGVA